VKRVVIGGVGVAVLGGLVAGWVLYGRFAVEGGRAPWAVINKRLEVLAAALPTSDQAQKNKALVFAVQRGPVEAVELLLAAGAEPNARKQDCLVVSAIHLGGIEILRLLLQAGADPKQCRNSDGLAGEFLSRAFDRAPEVELIWILRMLAERGIRLDGKGVFGTALDVATQKKLDKVLVYLRDPRSAPIEDPAKAPKLARRGSGPAVDRDALRAVCRGEGVATLPDYQKEPGLVSPITYFEQLADAFRFPGELLPRWWSATDDLRHTQVVACARVVDRKVVESCQYKNLSGGIAIYEASFELALREAKTGKLLATKTVALPADSRTCPMLKWGAKEEARYPSYRAELEALARPILGLDAP
jgi:hypothetical protein